MNEKNSINQNAHDLYYLAIRKGVSSLLLILEQYLEKEIELERLARVAVLLIKSGVSIHNSTFYKIRRHCLSLQKTDFGWIANEDSVWCVALLKELNENLEEYHLGSQWLGNRKLKCGGWGKTNRDIGRITITGILLYLLPELANKASLEWLEREWKKDFGLNPKLTYKAAFTLMAIKSTGFEFVDNVLFDNTLNWLMSQQNEDNGWGPVKGHPIGSTPFCTGVALIGLLQYPDKIHSTIITNGLKWLKENQLEDGMWPDHYIEEGSIWSLFALIEGFKYLKGK